EVEFKGLLPNAIFTSNRIGGDAVLDNDSFDTPQMLGSITDSAFGGAKAIRLTGQLQGLQVADTIDYYGVALMGGQQVTVQAIDIGGLGREFSPMVAVFDPSGRMITSNFMAVDRTALLGEQIAFTADQPGVYRVAVAGPDHEIFNGDGFDFTSTYSLRITNAGDIGLGGLVVEGNLGNLHSDATQGGITVWRGDFG